jgi:predicted phosphodiesterase
MTQIENVPLRLRSRPNPQRTKFPILLCEIALPLNHPGARLADGTTLGWSHLQKTPRLVALLGDTGCNLKDLQDCTHITTWPLPRIAMQAAWMDEGAPDLVVHVGDYRYRGKDDWSNWRDDFFAPARALLATAPWIMARGNHDNCFRDTSGSTGDGWSFLLEPTPDEVKPCDWSAPGGGLRIEEPYALDLGAVRIIVMDSADAYYRCADYDARFKDEQPQRLQKMLANAPPDAAPGRALWLVSHYPVFNAAADPEAPCSVGPKGKKATVALKEIVAQLAIDNGVQTVLSGDQHSFQVIPVAGSKEILQLVVGHGGTALDRMVGTPAPGGPGRPAGIRCQVQFGDKERDARGRLTHGYAAAVLKDTGWRFTLRTARLADQEWEIEYPSPSTLRVDILSLPKCRDVLTGPSEASQAEPARP